MKLHPCATCRRHVRSTESTCPFCGCTVDFLPVRDERARPRSGRAVVVSTTMGVSVLMTLEACGAVYGGPPVASSDPQRVARFDVPAADPDFAADFARSAKAFDCIASAEGTKASANCRGQRIEIYTTKGTAYVACEAMSVNQCRVFYDRIVSGKP